MEVYSTPEHIPVPYTGFEDVFLKEKSDLRKKHTHELTNYLISVGCDEKLTGKLLHVSEPLYDYVYMLAVKKDGTAGLIHLQYFNTFHCDEVNDLSLEDAIQIIGQQEIANDLMTDYISWMLGNLSSQKTKNS